uniref:Uncharacterized protein n=1 Tax=Lepeophtheirus salmonis TaxID=72036 RepID=A0A0K2VJE1_LEPSM
MSKWLSSSPKPTAR